MPAPTPNINITNHNTTNGPSEPTGEDDGGGGESEPANDPNKTTLNSGSANLQIPNKPNPSSIASSKSPKSPKSPQRPQISVEITPATPGTPAGRSPAPSAVSQRPSAGPQSPHEAVQSWVKSQDAHHHQEDPTTSTSSKAAPLLQKRDSAPATPVTRNRRPSASSQKSDRDFPRPPSAAGSISGGEGGGGGKFSLKELLGGGPKLSRRNSASSKKSVSSGKAGSVKGGGSQKGGSTAGESAALESKYGVYGKLSVGKGATSVVKLAHRWDRTEDKLYAVKEFRPRRNKESQRDYVKKLTSEFCISSALRHQNVVETVDLMQDQDAKWCEVMEFCPGGDLYNAIRKGGMSPAEVECCFKQILTGVGYLHAQGVAHRDLKPENIFFDAKGQIKIGDFGASTVFRLPWETTIHKSSGLCGSEPYIAPEQFTQPNSYDARLVDVWACGIVYYCLHFQELPWSCAQLSDKTYSQYAQQCASPSLTIAGIPFLKSATAGVSTPHTPAPSTPVRQDSGIVPTLGSLTINSPIAMTPIPGTPTTTSHANPLAVPSTSQQSLLAQQSRSEREKEQQREAVARYPATILNLSPRACRPVLRRMLEPKPEFRVTVEDVLKHPWIMEIEVCTDPGVRPKHMHPAAIAAANAGGIVTDK